MQISGTYNLQANPNWAQLPLQEIYLECDTSSAPVIVNLFEISTLNRFWNVKIYISDISGNAAAFPIQINSSGSDTIDTNGNTSISIISNGGSVCVAIASATHWIALESSGGSSVVPIDIRYTDLYDKIITRTLQAGCKYRLLDYQSTNFLNGETIATSNPVPVDPNFNPREVYTALPEVLILEATSSDELSPIASSEDYPNDIITYNALRNVIGTSIDLYNGDSVGTTGFDLQWDGTNVYFDMPTSYSVYFGYPLYLYCSFNSGLENLDIRVDSTKPLINKLSSNQSSIPYSGIDIAMQITPLGTKVVLQGLSYADYTNYDVNTLYVQSIEPSGASFGIITNRQDTIRQVSLPIDYRAYKYRRFEVQLNTVNPSYGSSFVGQGDVFYGQATTGNYTDFNVFNNGQVYQFICTSFFDNVVFSSQVSEVSILAGQFLNSTFTSPVRGVNCEGGFGGNTFFDVYYCNFKAGVYDNLVGSSFQYNNCTTMYNNIIGASFYSNDIIFFSSNDIGDNFYSNNIGADFNSNRIKGNFYGNTISSGMSQNQIDLGFLKNIILQGFYNNQIDISFGFNSIGVSFASNVIAPSFSGNTIGNDFTNNNVGSDFQYNQIANANARNTFGIQCNSNVILSRMQDNSIQNNFSYNNIGTDFKSNQIAIGFTFNNICSGVIGLNFLAATYVYGSYNCSIFYRSDSTLQLSYINGANVIQYASPTA